MTAVHASASRLRLAIAAAVLAAVVAPSAAASDPGPPRNLGTDPAAAGAATGGDLAATANRHRSGSAGAWLAGPAVSLTNAPAANLRVNLDRLLAEHAFLTIE